MVLSRKAGVPGHVRHAAGTGNNADAAVVKRVGEVVCDHLGTTRYSAASASLPKLRRRKPEPKVVAFVAAQPLDLLYVSSVTFAEIRFGIELVSNAARRGELNDWLAHKVRPMFEQRVLAVSEDVMIKWRLLVEGGRKVGHNFRDRI
jgi:hypothetical protein